MTITPKTSKAKVRVNKSKAVLKEVQPTATEELYAMLQEYVEVEKNYKLWEKQRKALNDALKERITVTNTAMALNDIMYEKQVSATSIIKSELIRTLLKQEGRTDLLDAATETSERVTLKVRKLEMA